VRTPEERDEQTLLIVQSVVRFVGVVAALLCVLAAASLVTDIPPSVATTLVSLALVVGAAAAVAHLLRVGRHGRTPH
jgi:hypothetical protein